MDTDRLNTWLTLGANIGVLAGIIFLGLEIQQNSELMRIQINQARADAAMVSNEHSFNSDYLPAILVKIKDGKELSAEEWVRYVGYFRAMNRNQDNVLSQYHAGMLGDNIPRSVADYARDVVGSSDRSLEAWRVTKAGYTDSYIAFIEQAISLDDE
jgi:hypothetical protein